MIEPLGSSVLELLNREELLDDSAGLAEALEQWGLGPDRPLGDADHTTLRHLRALLRRLAESVATRGTLSPAELAEFNALIAPIPMRSQLVALPNGGDLIDPEPLSEDCIDRAARVGRRVRIDAEALVPAEAEALRRVRGRVLGRDAQPDAPLVRRPDVRQPRARPQAPRARGLTRAVRSSGPPRSRGLAGPGPAGSAAGAPRRAGAATGAAARARRRRAARGGRPRACRRACGAGRARACPRA